MHKEKLWIGDGAAHMVSLPFILFSLIFIGTLGMASQISKRKWEQETNLIVFAKETLLQSHDQACHHCIQNVQLPVRHLQRDFLQCLTSPLLLLWKLRVLLGSANREEKSTQTQSSRDGQNQILGNVS